MEKKIYTTPTLSVEEFKMSEIVCSSISSVDGGDTGMKYGGGSTSNARANNRDGIWDED